MSMMAINALKDAVAIFNLNKPSQIASHLYNELIKNNAKPLNLNLLLGIEFIVCKYTKNAKVLEYSGHKISFEYFDSTNYHKTVRPQRNLNRQLGMIEFNDECLDITKGGRYFFTPTVTTTNLAILNALNRVNPSTSSC